MKNQIRKQLIKIRKNISLVEVIEKSKIIKNKLFEMDDFNHASIILFYISYNNEVFTHEMIKEQLTNNKIIVVPIVDRKSSSLILSKLEDWNDLTVGAYNILEPKKERISRVQY